MVKLLIVKKSIYIKIIEFKKFRMLKMLPKQRKYWLQVFGMVTLMLFMALISLYSVGYNEERDRKLEALRVEFDALLEKHNAVKDDLLKLVDKSHVFETKERNKRSTEEDSYDSAVGGAVYIRWGRTTCPLENETELVYSGIAGGSLYTHEGAATNMQCLPNHPEWGRFDDGATGSAFMYGMEYEENMDNIMKHSNIMETLMNHNVPCAVCRNKVRPSSLMIPGKVTCFDGWKLEYQGYIMAGHHGHKAGSQYLCVDEEPEADQAGYRDENGALLHRVEAVCGSLPCPPYVANRELACVVCTK